MFWNAAKEKLEGKLYFYMFILEKNKDLKSVI